MKKLTFLAFAVAAVCAFSSCKKKDWVCECKTGSSVSTKTWNDATKRQAKANCVSYTVNNVKTECELK